MISAKPALLLPVDRWRSAYRVAIPAVMLCAYGGLAVLWHWGSRSVYFEILRFVGIDPFRFPFLDIHAVLAAAECQRQGVDVYLVNPCDAIGRPHVYSPLWLVVTPAFVDTSGTLWAGLGLDLLFILSLSALLRPRAPWDILVLGLAVFSPMTVFAIERANNDLVVFLLILCAGMLYKGPRLYRLCSYTLFLAAGLLKYYPLALLTFLARERRRDAVTVAIAIAATLVFFGVCFWPELGKALANIPAASYFTDSFSAENLPFGFGEAYGHGLSRSVIDVSLLGALLAVAGARALRTVRLLDRAELGWDRKEMQWLAIGVTLLMACFFAGQNINYRGIYFLLVVPGIIHLHRSISEPALRRFWVQMIAAVLFLMWAEFLRHALHAIVASVPGEGLSLPEVFFWIGRELVWWWLIAGLGALILSYFRQLPLAETSIVRFRHCLPLWKKIAKWGLLRHSPSRFR
jgi:Glycosyltransferase family 87